MEAVVLGQCTIARRRLQGTRRSSASATCCSNPLPSACSGGPLATKQWSTPKEKTVLSEEERRGTPYSSGTEGPSSQQHISHPGIEL